MDAKLDNTKMTFLQKANAAVDGGSKRFGQINSTGDLVLRVPTTAGKKEKEPIVWRLRLDIGSFRLMRIRLRQMGDERSPLEIAQKFALDEVALPIMISTAAAACEVGDNEKPSEERVVEVLKRYPGLDDRWKALVYYAIMDANMADSFAPPKEDDEPGEAVSPAS